MPWNSMLAATAVLAALASAAPCAMAAAVTNVAAGEPAARTEGPITGGKRGFPYSASIVELKPYGYTESEYFVSGVAHAFKPAPGTTLTPDGRWSVVAGDAAPYKTRIL